MVANVVRCTVRATGLGEEALAGFYLGHCSPPSGEADLASIVDAWDTNMNTTTTPSSWTKIAGCLSPDQHWVDLAMYFYADSTAPATYIAHKSVSHVGVSGAYNPLSVSGVVSLETSLSGPSNRGRVYVPATGVGIAAGHLFSDAARDVVASFIDVMGDALQAARGGSLGDPTRVVVYSPTKNKITDVTTCSVDNRPDTQRRRSMSQNNSARTSYTGPNP